MVVILYHLEHEYGRTRVRYESWKGRLQCLRSQDEHPLWFRASRNIGGEEPRNDAGYVAENLIIGDANGSIGMD